MAHTLGVGPAVGANTGTSLGVTLNGTTAGRGLIAGLIWVHATATITSVTCTSESNLTLIGSPKRQLINGADYALQLAYLSNNTGGGNKTVTMNISASSAANTMFVIEFAGGDTSAWYDSAEGEASSNTCAITTNTASDLIIGMTATDAGSDPTPGTGYTAIAMSNAYWWEEGEYDLDVGAAGAKTFDFSTGGVIKAAAFKIAGAAASGAGPLIRGGSLIKGALINGGRMVA